MYDYKPLMCCENGIHFIRSIDGNFDIILFSNVKGSHDRKHKMNTCSQVKDIIGTAIYLYIKKIML